LYGFDIQLFSTFLKLASLNGIAMEFISASSVGQTLVGQMMQTHVKKKKNPIS